MVDINLSANYILKNELLGSSKALASTSLNDSIVVQPVDFNDSQLWYFTETLLQGYYRLHTVGKGQYSALDVYNYIGRQAIDLHFYATQDLTGQYWHLNQQSDGSVKIHNNFTGPDMYLDLKDGTLQPTLAARDSQGQRWTLSSIRSTPTFTNTATISSSFGTTATPSTKSPSASAPAGTCTSNCLNSRVPSGSKKLSGAAVGGIVSAVVVAFLLAGAFILWCRKSGKSPQKPRQMAANSVLNA